MNLIEARRHLTRKEMEDLTERALARGPFTVDNVRRIGSRVEVRITQEGVSRLIVLDPLAVRSL